MFFSHEMVHSEDKGTRTLAAAIHAVLDDPYLCGHFYYLDGLLSTLGAFNTFFQAKRPLPHLLFSKLDTVKRVLVGYISHGGVRQSQDGATKCDFGPRFKEYLDARGGTMSEEQLKKLKEACWEITTFTLKDLDTRFPSVGLYHACSVVDPHQIPSFKSDKSAAHK